MKHPEELLRHIRALPEEARKILAFIGIAAMGVLVFYAWSFTVSRQLAGPSEHNSVDALINSNEPAGEEKTNPTPIENIMESIRFATGFILPSAKQEGGESSISGLKKELHDVFASSVEMAKNTWHRAYDPFR